MTIRSVKYELEAKLKCVGGEFFSIPAGKIERKSYGDGGERLKICLKKLKAPDGSSAVVKAGGKVIASLVIEGGSAKFDEEVPNPDVLPELSVGQNVEVYINDKLILHGRLYED